MNRDAYLLTHSLTKWFMKHIIFQFFFTSVILSIE